MPATLTRTPIQNQFYAKALLEMGMGIGTVARRVGMGKDTVTAVRDCQTLSSSLFENIKRRLPQKWARLADDTLDLMDRDDIKKASVNARAWIAGVATDKMQALEGTNRPIFNIVNVVQDISRSMVALEANQAALLALKSQRSNVGV